MGTHHSRWHIGQRVTRLVVAATTFAAIGVQVVNVPPARAGTVTTTFKTSGESTFAVPATVTSITVDAIGAPGADFTSFILGGPEVVDASGGQGGEVKATLPVTPNSTLYVEVNTGGGAGHSARNNGHGGGSSDIRTCSTTEPSCPHLGAVDFNVTPHQYIDPRLVVAAGGGGGGLNGGGAGAGGGGTGGTGPGNGGNGGNGGGLNAAGSNGTASGGAGGSADTSGHPAGTSCGGGGGGGGGDTNTNAGGGPGASCAGAGGAGIGDTDGGGSSFGLGGSGGGSFGGGGGSGWAGGGGGASTNNSGELGGGGGGAGSSYAVNTATGVTMAGVAKTVAPSVTISYQADNDLAIGTRSDITVGSTSHDGAVVTFTSPTPTDEGSETLSVSCDHKSGDLFPIGTTTVTCTATDSDDINTSPSSSFNITVNDDDLTISVPPSDITVDSTGHDGAPVTFTAPTAADEGTETPSVNCDHNSGDTFPIGKTKVTCTASDGDDSNSPSNSFNVTVNDKDLTLPTPTDMTVDSTSHNGATVNYTTPTAGDEGTETPSVSCLPASGSTFAIGTTTVNCTATDSGDSNSPVSSSFHVTVRDNDLTISSPPDLTVPAAGPTGTAVPFTKPTAGDEGTETLSVNCDHNPGATFPIGTTKVTCTATDGDDTNSPSSSFNVTVVAPPSIAKAFGASQVSPGGTTTLTFTLTNPPANTVAENGVAFTDPLPAGLVVASGAPTSSCGGMVTATPGSSTVSLSGGSIAKASSCTIQVAVTATNGGVKNNVTGHVTSTNGGTGNSATATLASCTRTVSSPTATFTATGVTCVSNTTVNGTITVPAGATLVVTNSTVNGTVASNGASSLTICGSHITESLSVQHSTGPVLVGDGGNDESCAGNTIDGSVVLTANTANTELGGNHVSGTVTLQNNAGGASGTELSPEIEANTITSALSCSGNSPSPTNDGYHNTVPTRSGQCATPPI